MVTQELVDAIFRATRSGDTEAVDRMLDEVPQLLSLEREGRGLLLEAVYWGHVGLVRLLVERGAGLEASDMFGNTPLCAAAACGHEVVVSILLHSGADITRRSEQGWTALSSASIYGHLPIIRLLLEHIRGRGLDARDEGGRTALWYACTRDHLEIARTLLLAGANHTIPNRTGSLGRQVAEAYGYQDIVALLDWWEGELQRAYILHKARTLHEDTATHQHTPAAPVPPYLRTRVLPSVEVVARQPDGQGGAASGKRVRQEGEETMGEAMKGSDSEAEASENTVDMSAHFERVRVEEEEMGAVVGFVAKNLAPELYIELQAAFHFTEARF